MPFNNHNYFSDLLIVLFIIFLGILLLIGISSVFGYTLEKNNSQNKEIKQEIETPKEETKQQVEIPKIEYQSLGLREITAYTASREETDNDPCITASGVNACESDLPIIATNELPFWTWVEIDGKEYVVLDRMNSRYKTRYDILMKTKGEAIQFGIQRIIVKVIK